MKLKDLMALISLAVVLLIVGSLVIGRLGGGKKARQAEIEIVNPIDPSFNSEAREIILNRKSEIPVENFDIPADLKQGLGNDSPFRAE